MNIRSIFLKRRLWKIGIYEIYNEDEIFKRALVQPFHIIGEKGFRKNFSYQSTIADPFLFVKDLVLYVFYEAQTDFGAGEIWAQSMNAVGEWSNHGCVIKENFHLSYPQVFAYKNNIYMVPEAAASGNVFLYRSTLFPIKWERSKVLVAESLLDPSIIIRPEGIYLFGTTRSDDLKMYHSRSFEDEFVELDVVISNCKSTARNAGAILEVNNKIYRVAQDCKRKYGEKIHVFEVLKLGLDGYSERLIESDIFAIRPCWASEGYHHLSLARLGDRTFVAVDGFAWDARLNKAFLIFHKFIFAVKKYIGL